MSMNLNMQIQEENREFMVLGEMVIIRCDEIEYNHIIMFLTNLHAFGKYYYDTWRTNAMGHYTASIYRKISQMDSVIIAKLPEYEESVLKKKRREYNINSLMG